MILGTEGGSTSPTTAACSIRNERGGKVRQSRSGGAHLRTRSARRYSPSRRAVAAEQASSRSHKVKTRVAKSIAPARSLETRRAAARRGTVRAERASSSAAARPSDRARAPRDGSPQEGSRARPALRPVVEGQVIGAHHPGQGRDQGRQDQAQGGVREARCRQCPHHRRIEVNQGFAAAARGIPDIDVLPVQGINVYDILRRRKLVLTMAGSPSAGGAI